jgi:hypothetical protein
MKVAVPVLCAVLAAGCNDMTSPDDPGVVCTAIAVSSLNVLVHDAETARLVCDASVVAIHQGGEVFQLERTLHGDALACGYMGPWERAGVFEVRATRDGYAPAAVSGVRVTADQCHVTPVSVSLDLRRD